MSRCAASLLALVALATVPAAGQVDPSGEWRTLHTTHFRIHFRPVYRGLAQQAANEAERAWGLLASDLPPPRGIIDLTLSDDVDAANGYATPVPSNRFTVLLTSGAGELPLQRFDSWVRVAIVHELAHLFHLDRVGGLWRPLQTVFGRAPGLFPNSYLPSWVVEGVATYYESRYTNAGRVGSDIHAEILAAQSAVGTPRSPWSAVFYTRWPAGWAPYAYGGQFIDAAFDGPGDSLLAGFMTTTARQLIPFRVARPYRLVTGRRLQTDWADFTRVPPAGALHDSATPGDQVLARGLRSPAIPRLSNDGRLVAYHHDDGRSAPEIRIVALDGWRIVRRHRVTTSVTYDWLGDTLVVAQLDFTARRRIRSDLYSWLPDGRWRRDTYGQRLTAPRAGGGILTAVAITPGGHQPYVAWIPLADTTGTTWGALAPSRDGRWVAATRHRDGHWALVRWPALRPDSAAVLVASREVISDPIWDDASTLYFVMPAGALPQIHQWTDSGPVVRTAAPLGARGPAVLNGPAFLYSTLGADGWELHRGAATEAVVARVEAPAPFDSAPPTATRETGFASWPSARPHYWLPLFVDVGAAGRFFGFTTSGSDAIGRTSYFLHGLASPDPGRAIGSALIVSEALGSPTLDAGVSNDWSLVGVTSGGVAVAEHTVEGSAGATFVARRWRTTAVFRFALEAERMRFHSDPERPLSTVCTGCVARDFVSGSASVRVGHFVSAPLAVSAQNGVVWSAVYRRREQLASDGWSGELQSRIAMYARLPTVGYAHPVLALRLSGGITHGPSPLFFGVGGVSSSVVDLGFGLRLGTSRAFPVRGYLAGDARGPRALTATAELRWPLALLGRSLGHLPLGADQLSLVLFADAGDAWSRGNGPHPSRMIGVGGEVVADLRVSYDLPLRARFGVAYPVGSLNTGRPQTATAYAALGADF